MGFGICLDIFRTSEVGSVKGTQRDPRIIQREQRPTGTQKYRQVILLSFHRFLKNPKIAGLLDWGDSVIRIVGIEAVAWANAFQRPKRQSRKIAISASGGGYGRLIMDKKLDAQEGLFPWFPGRQ